MAYAPGSQNPANCWFDSSQAHQNYNLNVPWVKLENMKTKHLITTLSLAALALTACSAEDIEAYKAEQEGATAEEADEEVALVEVPDLIEMNLKDAKTELKDLDLDVDEYDTSEDENSVLRSKNWEVIEQDPTAGTEVEPDTEILLGVQKIEDKEEPDNDDLDKADMPDPEDDYHAIALASGDPEAHADAEPNDDGDIIFVTFNIHDLGTNNMIANGAKTSTLDILEKLSETDVNYSRVFIQGSFPMGDDHGNIEDSMILNAGYDHDTVEQINFDNMNRDNIWDIMDSGMVHDELQD